MNKRYLSAAALWLLVAPPICAADSSPTVITITATRTMQKVEDAQASITVFTRQDIERLQANSVQDLINGVPGINITNNGGAGKVTSVFMRGTESDHVLVLIDGIKAGSATAGTTAFQDIPIDQIERIEIVRGPRSSLYGSEAIGGVIQIFTRKGDGATKPFFSIGAGSYNTYTASAGVSGGGERSWYSLSASGIDTEGFNSCNGTLSAGCYTYELDKDGYNNLSGALRAGYQFDNGLKIEVNALRATGASEFDDSFANESETVQEVVGTTLHYSPLDIWRLSLALGRSQDKSDSFKDGIFKSRFNTSRDSVSWQNDVAIADHHLLSLGLDYLDDQVDSSAAFTVSSRDNTGLFSLYQANFAHYDVQLSLRQDDNQQFGKHTTGGAGLGYALSKTLRLTGTYGTAYKAPSFNELYYPSYGNANLRPEESRSIEIGLSGQIETGTWSLNAYETQIDNMIAFSSITFAPANIREARIRGLEAILVTQLDNWIVNTNLTLLDPRNLSTSATAGSVLPRRSKQYLRLDVDRQFDYYSYGTSLRLIGKRYDDLANTRQLAGYGIIDLRAEYQLDNDWQIQARIENLLDKDYETAALYNQPGRSLFVTLRYQP
ncbi:MAG: TonB-dependent vitamin B12 receptor [Gammaproteobacteria bacterium]